MRLPRLILGILATALLGAAAACGGGGGDDESDADATPYNVDVSSANEVEDQTYDVQYDDEATVVEGDDMADVVSVSDDGKTVRLTAGSDAADGLKKGDPVLFAGETFGTVDSVTTEGDEVVVELGDATLNEIIKDGEFSWRDEIHWDELSAATLSESFHRVGLFSQETPEPTIATPEGLKFSGEIQGWQVEFELKPTAERLNMSLTAKYGEVVAVTGEGFITNFTEETLVKFEDSQFGEAAVRTTELETEMELKWHAFQRNDQAGLTEVAKFSLPVSFDIPFLIGPIPFQFSIKAVLQVVPAFESEASSGGSWKVNYTSNQGFKVANTLGGAIGRMTGASIDTSGETVTSGLGPAGFAVGVEFPRFELGVFGNTAVAFVTLKTYSAGLWTPGTTLTADIPPCQMGFTEVSAQYGYAFQILGGGVSVEATSDIWKQRINKFLNNKPCSLDGGAAPQDTLESGPGDSEIREESPGDEEADDSGDEEAEETREMGVGYGPAG